MTLHYLKRFEINYHEYNHIRCSQICMCHNRITYPNNYYNLNSPRMAIEMTHQIILMELHNLYKCRRNVWFLHILATVNILLVRHSYNIPKCVWSGVSGWSWEYRKSYPRSCCELKKRDNKIVSRCCLEKSVINRPLGYERVYLPLCKVADTPFHIQEDEMITTSCVRHLQTYASVWPSF